MSKDIPVQIKALLYIGAVLFIGLLLVKINVYADFDSCIDYVNCGQFYQFGGEFYVAVNWIWW